MAIKNHWFVRGVSLVALAIGAGGCGTAEFQGETQKSQPQTLDSTTQSSGDSPISSQSEPPITGTVLPEIQKEIEEGREEEKKPEGELALTWNIDCTASREAKQNGPFDLEVINGTDAEFKTAKFSKGTLGVKGKICSPKPRSRRVVFVVDVSESMVSNDPAVAGTSRCARVDAIESVISTFPKDGSVQFAVVTFDDLVQFTSGQFVTDLEAMKKIVGDMRPRRSWEGTLCARIDDTRFDVALDEAKRLFDEEKVDDQYSKEVYLITDGEPDPGRNNKPGESEKAKGLDQAKMLIAKKVSIATVMLGGTSDTFLKQLTSHPMLHRVASDTNLLEKQLRELSTNFYLTGKIKLTFGGKNPADDEVPANDGEHSGNRRLEYELLKIINTNGEFILPTLTLDKDLLIGHGITLQLSLSDRFGERTKIEGSLQVREQ